MKKTLIPITFSVLLFLTSCTAFHAGYMTSSASLSAANFSYSKQNVKGYAKATYVMGFGGVKKETLAAAAKENLLATNPVGSNQALANLSVNYKITSYFGFVNEMKCIVTADIVDFK